MARGRTCCGARGGTRGDVHGGSRAWEDLPTFRKPDIVRTQKARYASESFMRTFVDHLAYDENWLIPGQNGT